MKRLSLALLAAAAISTAGQPAVPPAGGLDAVAIPRMLSYQGRLADNEGRPVPDSSYSLTLRLYGAPSGGSALWSETRNVTTKDGLFSILLGAVTPIGSVPDAGALYLGMAVGGGAELAPRLRIVSAAYAYKADTANYALAAGDAGWVRADSVLYTVNRLGIARGGAANVLHGNQRHTHVNLGVNCTTGLAGTDQPYATVAGGSGNTARYNASTVGGGERNSADGDFAVVGGGQYNVTGSDYATVAGGSGNTAAGMHSFVGGGAYNLASGQDAMVPGGAFNAARNDRSFAAGTFARANHYGAFAWSDLAGSASESLYTTGNNQFRVRARGGTWFFSNTGMTTGAYLAAGSNSWQSACDSATKTDFREVDRRELLEKVAALRVRDYRMKDQADGTRHIGPVAQDFAAAFGYGESETGINMADMDGITLAAIQALYEQNRALFEQNREMRAELEGLKAALERKQ